MARHPHLSPADRERLATAIARKAWDLNQKLTELLAKQDVDLSTLDLPGEQAAGETPIERLRRYFDAVVEAQKRSRTEEFGLCVDCGEPIPLDALNEMPWRLRCVACARH